jgi:hypothetical protein
MLEPAWSPVGRAHPIEALPAASVHQHNGERFPHARGDHVLDVHLLPTDEAATRCVSALHVDPHEAPFGEIERQRFRCRQLGERRLCEARRSCRSRGQWIEGGGGNTGDAERRCAAHELAAADSAASVTV